ncbi:MAG: hypothetical protein C0404_09015 [Verrucomicrobia bacterium]|nr:hypothetical protein [Verrucomicrobiota bacterium]
MDWSAYRGGPERRGADLTDKDPGAGGTVWTFAPDTKTFYSSPAYAGGSVFVASANITPFDQKNGYGAIYRLDATNGAVLWKYNQRGFRATFSSPSVVSNYVVCGEGLHFCDDARIVCLTADKGELLWEVRTKSHVESSPAIANGKIYIGAGDNGLYCVGLEPKDGKADIKWHLEGKEYPDCEASPAVVDGKLYFCLGMSGMAVVCADAETGKPIWRTPAPFPVFGCPTVVKGKVIVGMGNGNMIQSAEEVKVVELQKLRDKKASEEEIKAAEKQLSLIQGEIWCLDAATGAVLWSNKVGRTVLGAIAYADDRLYAGSADGSLTVMTLDGKIEGKWNSREGIKTSPVVGRDIVYVVTDAGRVFGVDRRTLKPVWESRLGTGAPFLSSPAVGGGHLYVGTSGNGLLCVGQPADQERELPWDGYLGGPGKAGWADKAMPPALGRFAWRYPPEGTEEDGASVTTATARVSAPVSISSNAMYVALNDGRNGLSKMSLGKDRRKDPAELWFHPTVNGVYSSAASGRGQVLFIDGKPGDKGRQLRCISARDGKPVWNLPVDDSAPAGNMVVQDTGILIVDSSNRVSMLDYGSAVTSRWSATVNSPAGMPVESDDIVVVVSAADSAVYGLSVVNGRQLWRKDLKAVPTTGAIVEGMNLVVGTEKGLTVLGLHTGEERWSEPCGKITAPLVGNGGSIVCVTDKPEAIVFSWEGKATARLEGVTPGISPLVCNETMVCLLPESIQLLDMNAGKASMWLPRTGFLGGAITPAVLAEGFLYFGTKDKGLVCIGPK